MLAECAVQGATDFTAVISSDPCAVVRLAAHRVRLFATPWTVAHQAPPSLGILHVRILEWVVTPSTKGSSQPRDRMQVQEERIGLLHFTDEETQAQ